MGDTSAMPTRVCYKCSQQIDYDEPIVWTRRPLHLGCMRSLAAPNHTALLREAAEEAAERIADKWFARFIDLPQKAELKADIAAALLARLEKEAGK